MDVEKLRQLLVNMEREIESVKKQADETKRGTEKITREREIMSKNILRQQGSNFNYYYHYDRTPKDIFCI